MTALARIPLRVRIALAFAVAAGAVLVALGVWVRAEFAGEVDRSIRESLVARASDYADRSGGHDAAEHGPPAPGAGDAVQLLGAGRVLTGESEAWLSGDRLAAARRGPVAWGRLRLPDGREASVAARPSGRNVAVAVRDLAERDADIADLQRVLIVGVLAAMLVASVAGYAVAGLGLRPVEAMRRRASAIGAQAPGERLPEPVARDELRRLAQTLNGMLARLESGLRRERGFVADASHELRTPLARLRAELELATSRPRSHEELLAALRAGAADVDELVQLADDLLVLASADESALAVRRDPVAIGAMLEELVEPVEEARASSEPGLVVAGEPRRLRRAIGNLVDNAVRHGRAPIEVDARSTAGGVRIAVRDAGPGVPPAVRDVAFERFTRGDAARSGVGTGLGLAIVEAIARAHGGTAGLGPGSEVWILLPAAADPSRAAHGRASGEARPGDGPRGGAPSPEAGRADQRVTS